jgi:hypothetical protein
MVKYFRLRPTDNQHTGRETWYEGHDTEGHLHVTYFKY